MVGTGPSKGDRVNLAERQGSPNARKATSQRKPTCRRMAKNKVISSRLRGQGQSPVGWGSGSSLPSSIPQGERHGAVGILPVETPVEPCRSLSLWLRRLSSVGRATAS